MEPTLHWSRLRRNLVFLSLLCTVLAPRVEASPISYETHGYIWPWKYGDGASPGFSGPNVISFQGLRGGTISAGEAFPLGQFIMSLPPEGQSTTYDNASFSIVLDTSPGNQPPPAPTGYTPYSSVVMSGVLDGTITSSGESNVVAHILTIEPNTPLSTMLGSFHPFFDLPFPLSALVVDQTLTLVAPGEAGSATTLFATVRAVPEPSTSAMFLLGTFALGIGGWRRIDRH
jgi:PEP-CTERM motif